MPKYVTVLYTGEDVKAALIEANASRVAVEEICKRVGLRGVDVKWIFEEEMVIGHPTDPGVDPEDIVALVNDTSQGWLYPVKTDREQTFLIVYLTRKPKLYLELHLVNALDAYEALLDQVFWPDVGLRTHMKRLNATIDGSVPYEIYKVFTLDGTEVDLKIAREEYRKRLEQVTRTLIEETWDRQDIQ